MHRRIYQAIRSRDPEAARTTMDDHLQRALARMVSEETGGTDASQPPQGDTGS